MNIEILTIFPDSFSAITTEGMVARAIKKSLLTLHIHNIRDWTTDNYQSVDDHPYGGGAGMVMKIEPIYKALKEIRAGLQGTVKVYVTSAKGKTFTQSVAKELSQNGPANLILICGHYEGIDERVTQELSDGEISIGNYVLSGGELPAMVIVDALARLIPGVLGNEASLNMESHNEEGVLEYPQYTKPEVFTTDEGKELRVPEILLSGDHKKIADWQTQNRSKL